MDVAELGGLLSIKAVPIQAKAVQAPVRRDDTQIKPPAPLCGRSLRAALSFANSASRVKGGKPQLEASPASGLRLGSHRSPSPRSLLAAQDSGYPPLVPNVIANQMQRQEPLVPRRTVSSQRSRALSLEPPKAALSPLSKTIVTPRVSLQTETQVSDSMQSKPAVDDESLVQGRGVASSAPGMPQAALKECEANNAKFSEQGPEVAQSLEASCLQSVDTVLALEGDAFSLGDVLSGSTRYSSETSDEEEDLDGDVEDDEDDGDVEVDEDEDEAAMDAIEMEEADDDDDDDDDVFETEVEGILQVEDGVDDSDGADSDQPGITLEDGGQCDEEDASAPAPAGQAVLEVDADALNATAPAIIEAPKKKKKKKKKKKRRNKPIRVLTVVAEKKPPVPRFPHPVCLSSTSPAVEQEQSIVIRSAAALCNPRVPLKERLGKHLLLGRFSKKKAPPAEVDSAVEADCEEQEPVTQVVKLRRRPLVLRARSQDAKSQAPPKGSAAQRSSSSRPSQSRAPAEAGEGLGGLSIVGAQPPKSQVRRAPKPKPKKEDNNEIDPGLGALYFSFSSMRGPDGQKVPLKNRDKVVKTLHELNSKVALPICRHFGLRYNFFSEHHCQAKKAGVTCKEPLILRKKNENGEEIEEKRHLVTIRLRLRLHPTKGDPQTDFISKGTQMAVLLHELCHLKHMNHGKDFMLYLREIFQQARKMGIFDPATMSNEIPSPWPWENEIFRTGGDVDSEELLRLFTEHRAAQRAKEGKPPEDAAEQAAGDTLTAPDGGSSTVSTEASDGGPAPELLDVPPPPVPVQGESRHQKASEMLSLVSAFRGGSIAGACADGCCDPETLGREGGPLHNVEIAYGEDGGAEGEVSDIGGRSTPRLKLPPIAAPSQAPPSEPFVSLRSIPSVPVLPQING